MKKTMLASFLLSVAVPAFCQDPVVISGDVHLASGGTMYSVGEVNLRAGNTTAYGMLVNNGSITLKNGIRLYSNEDSDGMLFNFSQNIDISQSPANSIQVVKEFSADRWYYMSFPFDVNISEISSPLKSGSLAYSTNGTSGDFWITYYDGQRRSQVNSNTGNWVLMPSNGVLKAGVGYQINLLNLNLQKLVFPAASKTISVANDVLKNNNCKTNPSAWEVSGTTRPKHKGWNYVGTRHTGTFNLSAATMISTGAFNNTIHYYDRTTLGWEYMDIEDNEMVMPPHFAFLIQAAGTTGGFTFDPSGLDATKGPQPQFRSSTIPAEKVELKLAGNDHSSKLTFRFSDKYSETPSIEEDGTKMFSNNGVDIWSEMDGESLCVNRLPQYIDYKELSLGISISDPGTYVISMNNTYQGSFDNIILWDKELNKHVDLLEGDYGFVVYQALAGNERFSLELNQKAPTGIYDANANGLSAYINDGRVFVNGTSAGDFVSAYDAAGRLVYKATAENEQVILPLNTKGVFIIKVSGAVSGTLKVKN